MHVKHAIAVVCAALLLTLVGCRREALSRADGGVVGATTKSLTTPATNPIGQTITEYDSAGWINSDVIVAAPHPLLTATGQNKGATTLYIMFFDATSVPSNGTAPAFMPVVLAPGTGFTLNESDTSRAGGAGTSATGLPATSGWCWAASTTPSTLTVATTNAVWLQATYAQ